MTMRSRLAALLRRAANQLAPEPTTEIVRVLTPRPGDGPAMQLAREMELRLVLEKARRRYSPRETFEA